MTAPSTKKVIRKTVALGRSQADVVDRLAARYGLDFSSALRIIITQWQTGKTLRRLSPLPAAMESLDGHEDDNQVVRRAVSLRPQDVCVVEKVGEEYGINFSAALRLVVTQWQDWVETAASTDSKDTYLEIVDVRTDDTYYTGMGALFGDEIETLVQFARARKLENPQGGFLLDLYVEGALLDTITLDEAGVRQLVGEDEKIFPSSCYAVLDALYHRQITWETFKERLLTACEDSGVRRRFEEYAASFLKPQRRQV